MDEDLITARAMKRHGGSFVKALADCVLHADPSNKEKLKKAFPEYFRDYGPGSRPYKLSENDG